MASTTYEITMESVSRGITLSKDKRLPTSIPLIRKVVGLIYELVENGDEMDGKSGWAITVVTGLYRVSHMGLVVRRIEILAVPAGGEEDLNADALGTFAIW